MAQKFTKKLILSSTGRVYWQLGALAKLMGWWYERKNGSHTLPETNRAPENRSSQLERSLPTIHFQVQTVRFSKCIGSFFVGWTTDHFFDLEIFWNLAWDCDTVPSIQSWANRFQTGFWNTSESKELHWTAASLFFSSQFFQCIAKLLRIRRLQSFAVFPLGQWHAFSAHIPSPCFVSWVWSWLPWHTTMEDTAMIACTWRPQWITPAIPRPVKLG